MKKILRALYHSPDKLRKHYLDRRSTVYPNPIIVLGNQKSGTSAIAALLAELTGLSVTIDLLEIREPVQGKLHRGELSFSEFVNRNKYDFSKEIIKEPSLTFLVEDLDRYFPETKKVFIIRDPRDNIRSILNRVKIPGDLKQLGHEEEKQLKRAPLDWKRVIDSRWLGIEGENYIEWMAERWNLAVDIYKKHEEEMILVRYEDFVKDKVAHIEQLAQTLGLPKINGIEDKVDIQYQPAGNQRVNKVDFFGEENLMKIENLCGTRMKEFGYAKLL
ncbi:MAG TPA: sulfotransferase [Bacillales bacterium]